MHKIFKVKWNSTRPQQVFLFLIAPLNRFHFQNANTAFNNAKHGQTSQRDQMLKDLAAAFDAYIELSANLQEGTKVCVFWCV